MSPLKAAKNSTPISDLRVENQEKLGKGLQEIKAQVEEAEVFDLKGTEHQSGSVPAHGEVMSVHIKTKGGTKLGSAHVSVATGTVYPSRKLKGLMNAAQGGSAT